eukprot:4931508-Pleurochrysis_carterae.AAC.1
MASAVVPMVAGASSHDSADCKVNSDRSHAGARFGGAPLLALPSLGGSTSSGGACVGCGGSRRSETGGRSLANGPRNCNGRGVVVVAMIAAITTSSIMPVEEVAEMVVPAAVTESEKIVGAVMAVSFKMVMRLLMAAEDLLAVSVTAITGNVPQASKRLRLTNDVLYETDKWRTECNCGCWAHLNLAEMLAQRRHHAKRAFAMFIPSNGVAEDTLSPNAEDTL